MCSLGRNLLTLLSVLCWCVSASAQEAPAAVAGSAEAAQEETQAPPVSETIDVFITVSGAGDTIPQAKKAALEDGERKAFYMALNEIAPDEARDIYRAMREQNLTEYVRSFKVTRKVERAGSYEADITYRMDREKLTKLTSAGRDAVKSNVYEGKGLLIIPSYHNGVDLLTFERRNLWRAIMNNVSLDIGQGALVLPFGDPQDRALVTDETVVSGARKPMEAMARRYGTEHAVIAHAKETVSDLGLPMVIVELRKPGSNANDAITLEYEAKNSVETLDIVLTRAAEDVARKLNASIDSYGLFASDKPQMQAIVLRAEYEHGSQWRDMLSILRSIPGVDTLDIGAVGVRFAETALLTLSPSADIKRMMMARGLKVDDSRNYWIITLERAR